MPEPPKDHLVAPDPSSRAIEDGYPVPRVMPEIDGAKLNLLLVSLESFARGLLGAAPLTGSIGQLLPEDLAGDAIMSAIESLSGQAQHRKWDPSKCSMVAFCRGAHSRNNI